MMTRIAALSLLVVLAAATGAGASDAPTYSREIARIFQQHCQDCHRTGGTAPFPLETYDQAFRRREKILESVRTRTMPPSKPVPGYGDLVTRARLTTDEMATITRWVDANAPEGSRADLPAPRTFAPAVKFGKPDVVARMATGFTAPARSGDVHRCFSLPTTFAGDRYFAISEVIPGNTRIVHHMLAMVDPSGNSQYIKSNDGQPGYPCFGSAGVAIDGYLGGWTPGASPWVMPEGVGLRLPAGARIVIQMHYHNPRLTPETDRTELRLYASKTPVVKRLQFMRVGKFSLAIPAGDARHQIEAGTMAYRPMSLIAIHPHMHLLGRDMKVWAKQPDASITPLIHIDDWDFNWQGFYFFSKPVALPLGAWIEMTAAWDNSEKNPRNPSKPPQPVFWGQRTIDEMGHAAIIFTFDDEQLPTASTR